WAPGHKGVPDNERADTVAKDVAEGTCSPWASLPPFLHHCLPASIAALKAHWKKSLLSRWREIWRASPCYTKMSKID
ncbi:hypothetical protein K439DRAFT_1292385, partial [Ramaria rubella]